MSDLLDLLDDITAERLPCGHKQGNGMGHWGVAGSDEFEHAEKCLNLTCPFCHLAEPNGYHLASEHTFLTYWGTCAAQHTAFDRVAHCMVCQWPTFGRWPCRNQACPQHECGEECARIAGDPNYLDTHPWGKDAELGRQGLSRA
jgi:hypothetical protein